MPCPQVPILAPPLVTSPPRSPTYSLAAPSKDHQASVYVHCSLCLKGSSLLALPSKVPVINHSRVGPNVKPLWFFLDPNRKYSLLLQLYSQNPFTGLSYNTCKHCIIAVCSCAFHPPPTRLGALLSRQAPRAGYRSVNKCLWTWK